MREVNARLGEDIQLGRRGEHLATRVVFDVSEWRKVYGDGTAVLLHMRNGDPYPYPVVVEQENGRVTWDVTTTDLAFVGKGQAELQYWVDDTRVQSAVFSTRTATNLYNDRPIPPAPQEGWLKKMVNVAVDADASADRAEEAAETAGESATEAMRYAADSAGSADEAKVFSESAAADAISAYVSKKNAEAYATGGALFRDNGDGSVVSAGSVNGAEDYANQAKAYAEGGLVQLPVGPIAFPMYSNGAKGEADRAKAYAEGGSYLDWVYDEETREWKQVMVEVMGAKDYVATANPEHAVLYVKQVLTHEQKSQARKNIDALAPGEVKVITDYEELDNRPKINGKTLEGNLTNDDLGLASPTDAQVAEATQEWLDEHPEATTTVQDGSVTPSKTSFLMQKRFNLIDMSAVVEGSLSGSGDVVADATMMTTDYIPVKKSVYNASARPWYAAAYLGTTCVKRWSPENAVFDFTTFTEVFDRVRLAFYKGSSAIADKLVMFSEGALPSSYIGYNDPENVQLAITDEYFKAELDKIAAEAVQNTNIGALLGDHTIGAEKLTYAVPYSVNLLDATKLEPGYVGANGAIIGDQYSKVSDFIPVKEGCTYYGLGGYQCGLYDADKVFIKNFTAVGEGSYKTYTIPSGEGIAFMRVATTSKMPMVTENVPMLYHVPYSHGFKFLDDGARNDFLAYLLGTCGKRWFAVGDSITLGTGSDDCPYMGYIAEKYQYSVKNYGIAGTKLSTQSGDNGNSMSARIKTYDESECDIITIFGGTNDRTAELGTFESTDTGTVYGALHDICKTLSTKYAGKAKGFITPLKYTPDDDRAKEIVVAIKEVAAHYSIPVLDLSADLGMTVCYNADIKAIYCPDGLHPNAEGHRIMARKIGAWLMTL